MAMSPAEKRAKELAKARKAAQAAGRSTARANAAKMGAEGPKQSIGRKYGVLTVGKPKSSNAGAPKTYYVKQDGKYKAVKLGVKNGAIYNAGPASARSQSAAARKNRGK